ncbi:hypothetical protein KAR91_42930 [Candidatus Pacearchaeota archaeon]|nr:hypothetical protein [Candidatus Pacearchaeota archaeon]
MADIDEIVHPKSRRVICSYSDLLGFGHNLDRIKWKIEHKEIHYQSIKRIEFLIEKARVINMRRTTTLALNDCFAMNFDIDESEDIPPWEIWQFLIYSARIHKSLNKGDKKMGNPGVRTVWTAGERLFDPSWVEGRSSEPKGQDIGHPRLHWVSPRGKPHPETVREMRRISSYTPREFQLNIAFSKAFTLEEQGSRIGLKGPHIFVDESLFEILYYSHCGDLRKIKDCWGYWVVESKKNNRNSYKLRQKVGNEKFKNVYQLIFKTIPKKREMRWGKTSLYQLIEIRTFKNNKKYRSIKLDNKPKRKNS